MQSWQVKMASLLRQQREKGGVIDPSAEDDVIDDSWVRLEVILMDVVRNQVVSL